MQLQHFCSTKKFKNVWSFSKSLFSRALHPCMTTNHNFWPLFPLGKEEVGTVVDWQTICWGISACRPPCRRNTIYFPLKVSFNIKAFFFTVLVALDFTPRRGRVKMKEGRWSTKANECIEVSVVQTYLSTCARDLLPAVVRGKVTSSNNLEKHLNLFVQFRSSFSGDYKLSKFY